MSWVRPACSGVSSGDGALTVPFLAIDLGFCESPLLCFHPSLGDSFDPWLKSEGFRCSGVACFVLAIGVGIWQCESRYLEVNVDDSRYT